MNRNDIEARLEASLRKQVSLPALDSSFNDAVWRRIAAQEAPVAVGASRASRWLLASNVLGIGLSVVLILYFLVRGFSGAGVEVELPLPAISEQTTVSLLKGMVWAVTVAAVGFGFAFTRMGRRTLMFFKSEFA